VTRYYRCPALSAAANRARRFPLAERRRVNAACDYHTCINANISSGFFGCVRNPEGLFHVVPPPSAARSTARSSRAITCDAWNCNAPTSPVVALGEPSPPSPVPPTCQNRRNTHWVNLAGAVVARRGARPRSPASPVAAARPGPLIAARVRTSAMFRAILSIAALSFVSASSAIVAVVVAGSSVAPRRRRRLDDPGDDRSAAYSKRDFFHDPLAQPRRGTCGTNFSGIFAGFVEQNRGREKKRGPVSALDDTCFIDMAAAAPFV